jgi:uncharacterized Zn-finger protein
VPPCRHCGKQYQSLSQFKQHEDGCKVSVCNICNKSFNHIKTLKSHAKIHSNSHMCTTCEKTFPSNSKLERHEAIHLPAQHICSKCGKQYKRWEYLSSFGLRERFSHMLCTCANLSVFWRGTSGSLYD